MDYLRSANITSGYNPFLKDEVLQHLYIEVAFIDNSHRILKPVLFQLKNESIKLKDLLSLSNELMELKKEAFISLGEIDFMDKKKKLIILATQQTVSYNYLILVTGTEHIGIKAQEEGLYNGFQTLIHALRIRKVSSRFATARTSLSKVKIQRFTSFDSNANSLPNKIQGSLFQIRSQYSVPVNNRRYYFEVNL